jgi:hypothetical protein
MKGWRINNGWWEYGILWRDLFIVIKREKILPRQHYQNPDWM